MAIKCDYDFGAILRCLQAGRGQLVAICRRTGAAESLMLIHRDVGGNYQFRGNTGNLANLGLRLHATDGDLSELERRICRQAGMDSVVFYFAPSADLARLIISAQQSALDTFRLSHKTALTGTIVLNGRMFCTTDGAPSYII